MIRLFFAGLFDGAGGAGLNDYDYWMRMDTDSCLARPAGDPFHRMDNDPSLAYLYNEVSTLTDCGKIVEGLGALVASFAKERGIEEKAVLPSDAQCINGYP